METQSPRALFVGQESLTIHGALKYQACDDKFGYNPMSVPLSWTLQLKAIQLFRM